MTDKTARCLICVGREPFEMSIALGARPKVHLLQVACTSTCMCCQKYNWNIVEWDVEWSHQFNQPTRSVGKLPGIYWRRLHPNKYYTLNNMVFLSPALREKVSTESGKLILTAILWLCKPPPSLIILSLSLMHLLLLMNVHAWFPLYGLCRAVRSGKQANNSNENKCLSHESNQRPLAFQPAALDRLATGTDVMMHL